MMENNYIIYKAENKFTGYSYIGATTRSLDQRKNDHIYKSKTNSSTTFQDAIATYGADAFNWVQIDTASNNNELASKEINYISEFDTYENGLNSTKGGEFKKTVYQYNLDGSLNQSFEDLTTASISLGVRKQDISRACWSVNQTLGGFLWDYDLVEPCVPTKDNRRKEVSQYLLNSTFVAKFISVSEASKNTGVSKTCISRCCRFERTSSGGFIWQYS